MIHLQGTKSEILKAAQKRLPEEILSFIEKCMQEPEPHSQLIGVLHKIQGHFGYLSQENLEAVSQIMDIPSAKVSGVASFYHYFRLKPVGRYTVSVCLGTACHVKGADLVAKKLQEVLGVNFGETTKDGLFYLESTRCLGTCALAPVVKVEDKVYSQVTPEQVAGIIDVYIEKSKKS